MKEILRPACLIFALYLSAFLFSCKTGGLTDQEALMIREEIAQTINDYCLDVKFHGLTAELKYLDSTGEFSWQPPGCLVPISFDSVAAILKQNAPFFKCVINVYDSLKIVPIDKNNAVYSAVVRSLITNTRNQVSRLLMSETGHVIKRNDGWKLLRGETKILYN
jgi:hypothetical protein